MSVRAPLRYVPFRFLLAGRTINSLGNAIAPVALAFAVLDLTGSPSALGLVVGARMLANVLFLLFGGALADRMPKHLLMVGSSIAAAATQAAVAALVLTGTATIPSLIALSAVNGMVGALALPASSAIVPQLIPAEIRQQANALSRLFFNGAVIVGAPIGGVIVAGVGPGWGIAVDAATFALAALFFALLRIPPPLSAAAPPPPPLPTPREPTSPEILQSALGSVAPTPCEPAPLGPEALRSVPVSVSPVPGGPAQAASASQMSSSEGPALPPEPPENSKSPRASFSVSPALGGPARPASVWPTPTSASAWPTSEALPPASVSVSPAPGGARPVSVSASAWPTSETLPPAPVPVSGASVGDSVGSVADSGGAGRGGVLTDLRVGWAEFRSRSWLWVVVAGFCVINACLSGGMNVLGPVVADATIGRRAWGLVLAAQTVGMVLGALVAMRLRAGRLLLVGVVCIVFEVLPLLILGVVPHLGLLLAAMFLAGLTIEQFSVAWETSMQEHVPAEKLARVYSYDMVGSFVAIPVGQVAAGPIAEAAGVEATLVGAAVLVGLAVVGMLSSRDVRNLRHRLPTSAKAPAPTMEESAA